MIKTANQIQIEISALVDNLVQGHTSTLIIKKLLFDLFTASQQSVPQQPPDAWISVKDRLPDEKDADENGKVLIWRRTNAGQQGLSKSIFDWYMVKNCDTDTFWQPLPPPPKYLKGKNKAMTA
jgi:hypothetical protein